MTDDDRQQRIDAELMAQAEKVKAPALTGPARGIRCADMRGGDLGLPTDGYVFDTDARPSSIDKVVRWAEQLLAMKGTCAPHERPVCPIDVIGRGTDTAVRSLADVLPIGVEIYAFPGGAQVVSPIIDGAPTPRAIFYLYAP